MTYSPFQDSLLRSRGLVSGISEVQKFGRNPDVGTGAFEHVWFEGGPYNWLTGSLPLRIQVGGNAADTAAGAGAREIIIEGLDGDWNEVTASLATNGASASADTSVNFVRVNRAYVSEVGTYSSGNTGDITIETNPSGLVVANIEAGLGQTQLAHYSVPAGKTAYISKIRVDYSSNKDGSVRMLQRRQAHYVTSSIRSRRLLQAWDEFTGESLRDYESQIIVPEKSDTWFEAKANTTNGSVDITFDIILVDD